MTDPDGDALTIFREDEQIWITCTSGREEVTVGPLPSNIVSGSLLSAEEPLSAEAIAQELAQHLVPAPPQQVPELVGAEFDGTPPRLEIVVDETHEPDASLPREERREA